MLQECGVLSSTKWAEAQALCKGDPRWGALKSTGERRQAWTEFAGRRLKQEREEKRQKARKAKDNFRKMLAEKLEIDGKTRWRDAAEILAKDPRFQAVEDDLEREELVMEFVNELNKKEEEEQRAAQDAAAAELARLLRGGSGVEGLGFDVTYRTKWSEVRDVVERLGDRAVLAALDEKERRHVFSDYIRELERAEEERRRLEKDEQRRLERQRREEFRQFLQGKVESGDITANTKWKDLRRSVEEEPEYQAMSSTQGSTSGATQRDVFDALVDELRKQFRDDRRRLEDLLSASRFKVVPETTLDELLAALEAEEHRVLGINLKGTAAGKDEEKKEAAERDDDQADTRREGKEHADADSSKYVKEDGAEAAAARAPAENGDNHEAKKEPQEEGEDAEAAAKAREEAAAAKAAAEELAANTPLAEMRRLRMVNIRLTFDVLVEKAVARRKEEERQRRKREDAFKLLLDEYFYRSDQVGLEWEDARDRLAKHSVFRDIGGDAGAKPFFEAHMRLLEEAAKERARRQAELLAEKEAREKEREAAAAARAAERAEAGHINSDSEGSHAGRKAASEASLKRGRNGGGGGGSRRSGRGRSGSRSSRDSRSDHSDSRSRGRRSRSSSPGARKRRRKDKDVSGGSGRDRKRQHRDKRDSRSRSVDSSSGGDRWRKREHKEKQNHRDRDREKDGDGGGSSSKMLRARHAETSVDEAEEGEVATM